MGRRPPSASRRVARTIDLPPARANLRPHLPVSAEAMVQLLLHVGPPKTGSTHIQYVFSRLLAERRKFGRPGECWEWPSYSDETGHVIKSEAAFLSELESISAGGTRLRTRAASLERLRQANCSAFISSETFACLSHAARTRVRVQWTPPPVRTDVVLVYRSDRVATLRSFYAQWHGSFCTSYCGITGSAQIDSVRAHHQPCPTDVGSSWMHPSRWLFKLMDDSSLLHGVSLFNTRGVAERFAAVWGRNAIHIIHSEGAKTMGVDLVEVIACDVMKVPCDGSIWPSFRTMRLSEQQNTRQSDEEEFVASVLKLGNQYEQRRCGEHGVESADRRAAMAQLATWAAANATRRCTRLSVLTSALTALDLRFVHDWQDQFLALNVSLIAEREATTEPGEWCEPDPVEVSAKLARALPCV